MKTDKKIIGYNDLKPLRKKFKNKKISFTSGCFDILHLGHVIHLNYCKSNGDILVVSLGNDKNLRHLKGSTRPINNQKFRARLLASMEVVDFVIISRAMGKMDHNKIIELLKPDYYIVPITDSALSEKKSLIENNGGKLITCNRLPPNHTKGGISSTEIEKKLLKQ